MAVGSQQHVPVALSPERSACTHCRGDWLGPKIGLHGMRMRKLLPRPGFETRIVPPVAIRCNMLPIPRMRSPLGLTCFLNTLHVLAYTLGGSCQTTQGSGLSIRVHVSRGTSERHTIISLPQCRPCWQDSQSTQSATVFPAVSLSVINTQRGIVCYNSSNAGQKRNYLLPVFYPVCP
jgi:hypothetical protein